MVQDFILFVESFYICTKEILESLSDESEGSGLLAGEQREAARCFRQTHPILDVESAILLWDPYEVQ